MAARHKAKVITGDGPRTCFEASLKRGGQEGPGSAIRRDHLAGKTGGRSSTTPPRSRSHPPRKELIQRLLKRRCELCEQGATVAVHQVARPQSSFGKPRPGQPAWAALMARMRRKTLIVCAACHDYIHANPVTHAA